MPQSIDLLITNIGQLCTIPDHDGGPQRGSRLGDLGIVTDAAIAIDGGRVLATGPTAQLNATYVAATTLDANGQLVTPGLVDPHTHAVWAGARADEFERRIAGDTYQQIMAEGGGINRTVRTTRAADLDTLINETRPRLDAMLVHGTTTAEIKTGYGLDTAAELRMLYAIARLEATHSIELAATFLGAHAIPPEYAGNTDGYVTRVIDEMLPAVAQWRDQHWTHQPLFCDVFCEAGVFDVAQSRRILEAGQQFDMPAKLHVDEFEPLGGARLAADLGAVSADHIVVTPDDEIAALGASPTVAVSLPPTPFGLAHTHYTPARKFLDAGAVLAIATDCNPGTGWNENMQFVMALATRYLRLTPAQALVAATLNAAHAIRRGHDLGSLQAGRQADVVIWRAPSYEHLSYRFGTNLAQTVIKRGQIVCQPIPGVQSHL